MDFYCGTFVVPKDQDLLDSISSPDSWSNWGMSSSDNFSSLNKVFTFEAKTTKGDFDFNLSFGHDTRLEKSFHDKPQSGGSGTTVGSSELCFNQRAVSYDQTNYQFQDLEAFEATDDYFLDSILDYPLTGAVNDGKHFCTSSGYQCSNSCCDNLLADTTRESSSTANDVYNLEVSEYAKPLHFSPQGDCSAPFSSKERSYQSTEGEPVESLAHLGKETGNHYSCEDLSLEGYILQELELVIAQFTEKTRICFRDALYRLARNSIQQHTEQYQDGECIPIGGQTLWIDPMSSIRHGEGGETKATELETKAVDRAIANLMFDKINFNLQDVSASTSANSDQQMMGIATVPLPVPGSPFSSTQIQNLQYLPNSSQCDA